MSGLGTCGTVYNAPRWSDSYLYSFCRLYSLLSHSYTGEDTGVPQPGSQAAEADAAIGIVAPKKARALIEINSTKIQVLSAASQSSIAGAKVILPPTCLSSQQEIVSLSLIAGASDYSDKILQDLGLFPSTFTHGFVIRVSLTTYHFGAVSSTGRGNVGCIISTSIGLLIISTSFVPIREQPLIVRVSATNIEKFFCIIF